MEIRTVDPQDPRFLFGPPLLGPEDGLMALPPTPSSSPQRYEFQPVQQFRTYRNGRRERIGDRAYRLSASLIYPHFPVALTADLMTALNADPLWYAPYSLSDGHGGWTPYPQLFEVHLLGEVPSAVSLPYDWMGMRIELEGVEVLDAIPPISLGGGGFRLLAQTSEGDEPVASLIEAFGVAAIEPLGGEGITFRDSPLLENTTRITGPASKLRPGNPDDPDDPTQIVTE